MTTARAEKGEPSVIPGGPQGMTDGEDSPFLGAGGPGSPSRPYGLPGMTEGEGGREGQPCKPPVAG